MMADKEILSPRAAGRYIAEHSRDVKVSQDGIQKTAKKACGFTTFIFIDGINSVFSRLLMLSAESQVAKNAEGENGRGVYCVSLPS